MYRVKLKGLLLLCHPSSRDHVRYTMEADEYAVDDSIEAK